MRKETRKKAQSENSDWAHFVKFVPLGDGWFGCFNNFDRCGDFGVNGHASLVLRAFELDYARDQRVERVIVAHANVGSLMELGAALANQNLACFYDLSAVALNAQHLRF